MLNYKTRIRTVQQCLNEIKVLDPLTAVTENFIRTLCKNNQIKHFKSGSKYLVNLDNLLSYLGFEVIDTDSITF